MLHSREEPYVHHDMGTIDAALMLFGGPYSNLQATQALLDQAVALQISDNRMICTGDVVAYCADAKASLALLQSRQIAVVAGNCEKQLAQGAPDCGCGFDPGSACDLLSAGWYRAANRQLGAADRSWMASCPDSISFRHQGARYAVIHGGVSDIARFIWPVSADDVFDAEWDLLDSRIGPVDHIIAGHCGLPFLRETPRGRWINPGVIGMPPNDGAPQTRFAVLEGGDVTFHHLTYDVAGAAQAMQDAGLVQGYDAALRCGYWPSEDVLPAALRARG